VNLTTVEAWRQSRSEHPCDGEMIQPELGFKGCVFKKKNSSDQ
jgi:hypothetical protein